MAPSTKANVKQKGKEYVYFSSTLKIFSQLKCEVQKSIQNEFFWWKKILKSLYIYGLYALEWEGSFCHLHLQMVYKLHISSLTLNQAVKCQFGWNDLVKTPIGHVVDCKLLEIQGLYTFVGLKRDCLKDAGKEHFKVIDVNVSKVEINVGIDEYMNFGTTSTKNHVALSNVNITQGFCMLQVPNEKTNRIFFSIWVIGQIQFYQFYPSTSWVMPSRQGGMDLTEACSTWKCMIMLSKVSMDDICTKKFECTRQKSWLRNFRSWELANQIYSNMETQVLEEYCLFSHVKGPSLFKLVICTCSKGLGKENLLLETCHCPNRNVYIGRGL